MEKPGGIELANLKNLKAISIIRKNEE